VDPRDDPDTIKTVIDRTLGFLQWVKWWWYNTL
jgi:hypothetical protein